MDIRAANNCICFSEIHHHLKVLNITVYILTISTINMPYHRCNKPKPYQQTDHLHSTHPLREFHAKRAKANNGDKDKKNSNLKSQRKYQQIKKWCRITGILYTIIIIFGIYADVGVRENYINFTLATETVSNVETHALQSRSTVLFELIMCCSDVGVAILLSAILYSVDTKNAILIGLMAIFRLMQTSLIASNLLHSFAASLILDPSFDAVTVAGVGLESLVEQDTDGEKTCPCWHKI